LIEEALQDEEPDEQKRQRLRLDLGLEEFDKRQSRRAPSLPYHKKSTSKKVRIERRESKKKEERRARRAAKRELKQLIST
jgi:hypothetical protein